MVPDAPPHSQRSSQPSPFASLRVPAAILLLLGIFLFRSSLSPPRELDHCIVIDAGSSGTRLHVFSWEHQDGGPFTLPRLQDAASQLAVGASRRERAQGRRSSRKETEPGLDKFLKREDELRQRSLGPLLTWALSRIPVSKHSSTPIFLFATAGVRRMAPEDSTWIMQRARQVLGSSPFLFKPGQAQILQGSEEATFGWVALNYLRGSLSGGPIPEGQGTYGVLDLGGSSLEVTFELPRGHETSEYASSVFLGGRNVSLYARSFEGYGMNDAFDYTVGLLLGRQGQGRGTRRPEVESELSSANSALLRGSSRAKTASPGAGTSPVAEGRSAEGQSWDRSLQEDGEVELQVEHPCLHAGYKGSHIHRRAARLPLVDTGEGGAGGGSGAAREREARLRVLLIGKPDAGECAALARAAVTRNRTEDECALPECALGMHGQPRFQATFFALTGFHIVSDFFFQSYAAGTPGVQAGGGDASADGGGTPEPGLGEIVSRGAAFCLQPWEEMDEMYGHIKGADMNCFRAPYVAHLLRAGLGMGEEHLVLGQGDGVSWTLGAALLRGLPALHEHRVERQRQLGEPEGDSLAGAGGAVPLALVAGVVAAALGVFLALVGAAMPDLLASWKLRFGSTGLGSWPRPAPGFSLAVAAQQLSKGRSPTPSPGCQEAEACGTVPGARTGALQPRRTSPERDART